MKRRWKKKKTNKGGRLRERVKSLLVGDSFIVNSRSEGSLARYAAQILRFKVKVRKADFGDGWAVVRIK